MSTLYLGTDIEQLARRLARHLDRSAKTGDFFERATIVIPHRAMGQWLRLWLARQQGVAINLRFLYLENALWEMLRFVDPRPQDPPPELLDGDCYRLLVLAVLQENREPGLEYWQNFLQRTGDAGSRLFNRRLWHLADQLASLIRDYEYHRQDAFIQHWLRGELGLSADSANLEQAQQAVFHAITRLPDGKRAQLNQASQRNFKTLPQYAMEVMETVSGEPSPVRGRIPRSIRPLTGLGSPISFHLFGLAQISTLHAKTLRWLGQFFDLHVYHFNVLAGRLVGPISNRPGSSGRLEIDSTGRSHILQLAQEFREPSTDPALGSELLHFWGRAGAESLHTMSELCAEPPVFSAEVIQNSDPETDALPLFEPGKVDTVLSRLQDHLECVDRGPWTVNREPDDDGPRSTVHGLRSTLPQDRSLQVAACPGPIREVETVYHSILANLQKKPDLKQSDIAILATDMGVYRPILQSVFERREQRIHYNLGDFSAAGVSVFAQGLLGLLDLALDTFTRARVFELFLNPCFLARQGVDRSQALVWLDWVEALGIYQSWDQKDKKERGYADTPLFAWQLGLRRLRLGRIMEVVRDDGPEPAPRFESVIPYADLHSSDPEEVNAFCLAVEGLLPRLAQLRHVRASLGDWVGLLEGLMSDFLAIPEDRPEEAAVRDRLLSSLQNDWRLADSFSGEPLASAGSALAGGSRLNEFATHSLALIREMLVSSLEGIDGARGQYLTGGVTIASLQPLRPMPFRIVYVLGLGEEVFPGANALSGLDLRGVQPMPGDIRPAEFNRYLFLETLRSAKDKIYLTYNCLDIQKDQILHPSVPLQQLKRFLGDHILTKEFEETRVPLLTSDEAYLHNDNEMSPSDVLVQFDESERLLALASAQRGGLVLSETQQAELAARQDVKSLAATQLRSEESALRYRVAANPTVTLHDLSRYLEFPVSAALKYHLHLQDDDNEEPAQDEPFVSDSLTAHVLMRQTLNAFVLQTVQAGVDGALAQWEQSFVRTYDEWGLRGRVPEEDFGKVDRAVLQRDLEDRIAGKGGLARFLRTRQGRLFCGPVLLGESPTPIGARERFPALELPLSRELQKQWPVGSGQWPVTSVRLVGFLPLVWRSEAELNVLIWFFQNRSSDKDLYKYVFEPLLFFLALKASPDGPANARSWLGDRSFSVHVAHADGIAEATYVPDHIGNDQARSYLSELATDFLDPGCIDKLPLRKILDRRDLRKAITASNIEVGTLPEDFQGLLDEALDEDGEERTWNRWASPLVALVNAQVPPDAFSKIRRRFQPIGCFEWIK